MAAGRPTDYKPEYCELVIELGRKGMSVVEMASEIGVARNTLETLWTAKHPEFQEAFTKAREASQSWWEAMGRTNLIMPPQSGTFQASVWSRSMAARFPNDWREKSETAHTGPNGGPLEITQITRKVVDPKAE
jgi:transposase